MKLKHISEVKLKAQQGETRGDMLGQGAKEKEAADLERLTQTIPEVAKAPVF